VFHKMIFSNKFGFILATVFSYAMIISINVNFNYKEATDIIERKADHCWLFMPLTLLRGKHCMPCSKYLQNLCQSVFSPKYHKHSNELYCMRMFCRTKSPIFKEMNRIVFISVYSLVVDIKTQNFHFWPIIGLNIHYRWEFTALSDYFCLWWSKLVYKL